MAEIKAGENCPYISIVIPTWNRKKDLIDCIDSVQRQNYPQKKIEVVVYDNASTDGTSKAMSHKYINPKDANKCRVVVIKSVQNIGTSMPFNKAIRRTDSKSEFAIGMDDDVVLERDCIRNLVATIKNNPEAGVVGARSVYFEDPGKTAYGAGRINWWLTKFSHQDSSKLIECDYVIGCCFLFRKQAFLEVGGIDPDYCTCHWEMDFCTRIKRCSYKIFYQPQAVVRHKVSVVNNKRSRLYYLYRNKLMIIRKVAPPLAKISSLLVYVVLWIPKIFGESLIYHKGLNRAEMKIILKSVVDGFTGVRGRISGQFSDQVH